VNNTVFVPKVSLFRGRMTHLLDGYRFYWNQIPKGLIWERRVVRMSKETNVIIIGERDEVHESTIIECLQALGIKPFLVNRVFCLNSRRNYELRKSITDKERC